MNFWEKSYNSSKKIEKKQKLCYNKGERMSLFENRCLAYRYFTREEGFDFRQKSAIGVGGKAEICFCPKSLAELTALLGLFEKDGVEYDTLGNLTNVLPTDGDTKRVILRLNNLQEIFFSECVSAYAGVQASAFTAACKKSGLSGAEFLTGIPCTIGGALFMNAGAGGRYIASIVDSVLVYRNGALRLYAKDACDYAYKSSVFMREKCVIVGANFRLEKATIEEIESKEEEYKRRRLHLPKGRSMGCVFKNPENAFAGELIEKSGLKGMRIGGARISETHGNFILNDGGATAADIKRLILLAKNAVYAQYGVRLEEEIRYLE